MQPNICCASRFTDLPPLHHECDSEHCPLNIVSAVNDERLVAVFRDLQHFCRLMNAASLCADRLRDTEFQEIVVSVQYRLLSLQGETSTDLSECLRLSMLVFLTTAFQVPETKSSYPHLAHRLQHSLMILKAEPVARYIVMWMLVMVAVSIYRGDEPWLVEKWKMSVPQALPWRDARKRLQEIMWINAIHDRPGECAYNMISKKVAGSETVPCGVGSSPVDSTGSEGRMLPPILRRDRF